MFDFENPPILPKWAYDLFVLVLLLSVNFVIFLAMFYY